MPWMPAPSRKRQINWLNGLSRHGSKPTAIVLHITASEATSQYGYFARVRFAGSHFHVARSGAIEQYAGTGARSAADLGSRRTISIETQGANGPWTAKQLESIAQVVAWCARTHDIPLRLMTSSSLSQHGLGWHRLGIDGNFPSGLLGGRQQRGGGELWSSSRGKACPTDPCVRQMEDVLRRAKEINSGKPASRGDDRTPVKPVAAKKRKPHRIGTVRKGDRSWRTRLWQQFLIETGDLPKGSDDGVFGAKTEAGTKKWQRRARIEDDGVVGRITWYRAIRGTRRGKKGARVKIAQRVLGLTGSNVDGVAGPVFDTRTKEVQRWLGVVPDGVNGSKTTDALVSKG